MRLWARIRLWNSGLVRAQRWVCYDMVTCMVLYERTDTFGEETGIQGTGPVEGVEGVVRVVSFSVSG